MSAIDPDNPERIRENLQRVRERVVRAAEASGRDPAGVQIMAVTKTHPLETVRAALRAELQLFGENRIQEAEGKYAPLVREVASGPTPAAHFSLHLIGHLQRNKARTAATLFDWVQSIDKYETAAALDRHCGETGRRMDVLLELNTSGEESKFGCQSEGELRQVLERVLGLEHLHVRGLMTVGPFTEDQVRIRGAFARLATLFARLGEEYPRLSLDTLSMGMSGDFEAAVQEGATMVRLGTVLFGPRST